MSHRLSLACVAAAVTTCCYFSTADADPQLPMASIHRAPHGYLLVDEEMWSQLMDEAGKHLDRARDAFLHGHSRTVALEIQKAAIMMRIDAAHGQDEADLRMLKAARELEHLAERLQSGRSTDTIDDLDTLSSKALGALAEHEHIKAANAWKHHHHRLSGRYLRAAADNLERATFRARAELSTAASKAIKNARILSGKLIEGTGYAIDEVGADMDAIGHQVERLGKTFLHPHAE